MYCPLRAAAGGNTGVCVADCVFREKELDHLPSCMIAHALSYYVHNQREELRLRQETRNDEPWSYNWGGVE